MEQKKYDLLIAVLVFIVQLPMLAFITLENEYGMFGAEYGDIAASVLRGDGYANVIPPGAGVSTAWMLPLLVYFLVGVFWLFGVKTAAAAYAIMVVTYLLIAATAYLLLQVAKHTGHIRIRYLVVLVFLSYVLLHKSVFLAYFSDITYNLFVTAALLGSLVNFFEDKSRRNLAYLLILAGILPLSNPGLSLAFLFIMTAYLLWTVYAHWKIKRQFGLRLIAFGEMLYTVEKRLINGYLCTIAVFVLVVSLWGGYNYSRLGKFIPSKSNMWHELYLSNYHDADGIPTSSTFRVHHLGAHPAYRKLYFSLGEVKTMEIFRDKFLKAVREQPGVYAEKIKNRLVWALVWSDNREDYDNRMPDFPLQAGEMQKLKAAQLILPDAGKRTGGRWTPSVTHDEQTFIAEIKKLSLENEQALIQDWRQSRAEWIAWKNRPVTLLQTLFESFIPFLCFVFGLLTRTIRNKKVFVIALAMYLVYLAPYILASHYFRYHLPLIPLQAIACCYTVSYLAGKLFKATRRELVVQQSRTADAERTVV